MSEDIFGLSTKEKAFNTGEGELIKLAKTDAFGLPASPAKKLDVFGLPIEVSQPVEEAALDAFGLPIKAGTKELDVFGLPIKIDAGNSFIDVMKREFIEGLKGAKEKVSRQFEPLPKDEPLFKSIPAHVSKSLVGNFAAPLDLMRAVSAPETALQEVIIEPAIEKQLKKVISPPAADLTAKIASIVATSPLDALAGRHLSKFFIKGKGIFSEAGNTKFVKDLVTDTKDFLKGTTGKPLSGDGLIPTIIDLSNPTVKQAAKDLQKFGVVKKGRRRLLEKVTGAPVAEIKRQLREFKPLKQDQKVTRFRLTAKQRAINEAGKFDRKKGETFLRRLQRLEDNDIIGRKEIEEIGFLENKFGFNAVEAATIRRNTAIKEIIGEMDRGLIDLNQVDELAKRQGITTEEVLSFLFRPGKTGIDVKRGTLSGVTLNEISQASKLFDKTIVGRLVKEALGNDKAAIAEFDKLRGITTTPTHRYLSAIWEFMKPTGTLETRRRIGLVSQLGTAMRNGVGAGARMTVDAFEKSFAAYTRTGELSTTLVDGMDNFVAAVNRLRPSQRKIFNNLLESDELAHAARVLESTAGIAEVGIKGALMKGLTIFNRWQERFARGIAFEAKARQLLRRQGKRFETATVEDFTDEMTNEVIDFALKMTFASPAKRSKDFIRQYTKYGGTIFINPFPRFTLANALPFIAERTPLGYFGLLSKKVKAGLLSGDPELFNRSFSEATLGMMTLESARRLRQSEFAGDKPGEFKIGKIKNQDGTEDDRIFNAAHFGPFAAPLFIAEALDNPENLTISDAVGFLTGIDRRGGVSLVLGDLIRGEKNFSDKGTLNGIKAFASQYLQSSTTPLRQFVAASQTISGDRKTDLPIEFRSNGILGPALENIPFVRRQLDRKIFPTTNQENDSGSVFGLPRRVAAQFPGLSIQRRNALQTKLKELKITTRAIMQKTDSPEFDNIANEILSSAMFADGGLEDMLPHLEQFDKPRQETIIKQWLRHNKSVAKQAARIIIARSGNAKLHNQVNVINVLPPENKKRLRIQQGKQPRAEQEKLKAKGLFVK